MRTFLLLFFAALAAGCPGEGAHGMEEMGPHHVTPMELEGTQWIAQEIRGAQTLSPEPSTLQLLDAGKVAGSGGCNRYQGGLASGVGALFGPLASTRRYCQPPIQPQEDAFFQALAEARSFAREGETLLLLDADGGVLVRFAPLEED